MRRRAVALFGVVVVAATGCGGGDDSADGLGADTTITLEGTTDATTSTSSATTAGAAPDSGEQRYPDVLGVEATPSDDGTWSFAVTISSPYDTPERYADGWRVLGPDGEVYGEHMLMHDHAGEQPFTRTQRGVTIPTGVDEVTVEGRDQEYGYGGATVTITLGG